MAIPPAAFTPLSDTYQYDKTNGIVGSSTSSQACFSAPVNLPQAAIMETLSIWYQRYQGIFTLQLLRKGFNNSNETFVGVQPVDTSGTRKAASFSITSVTTTKVNNLANYYELQVCMSGTLNWLQAARVTFTYSNAGD